MFARKNTPMQSNLNVRNVVWRLKKKVNLKFTWTLTEHKCVSIWISNSPFSSNAIPHFKHSNCLASVCFFSWTSFLCLFVNFRLHILQWWAPPPTKIVRYFLTILSLTKIILRLNIGTIVHSIWLNVKEILETFCFVCTLVFTFMER